MTALEATLNGKVPFATAALEAYFIAATKGSPPTEAELIYAVERTKAWIVYYAQLGHYPQRVLFNRALLLRASSNPLSDVDVQLAREIAERAAHAAIDDALRGRPRTKRRTDSLAEHLKSEARAAMLIVADQYEIPRDWRPASEPDEDGEIAPAGRRDTADYHDNDEDAEARDGYSESDPELRRSKRLRVIDNATEDDVYPNRDDDDPVTPREWIMRTAEIENRALARRFANMMTSANDVPTSAAEWSRQNRERELERTEENRIRLELERWARDLKLQLPGTLQDWDHDRIAELATLKLQILQDDAARNAAEAFRDQSLRALRGDSHPAKVIGLDRTSDEPIADEVLTDPIDREIYGRRNDGYGSAKAHWTELRAAGVKMSYGDYRQRRSRIVRKVNAERHRRGLPVRRVFSPEPDAVGA